MPICNQGEFLMEPKDIKQRIALEEVSPTSEISEEKDQSLKWCNRIAHDKLLEMLPPMKDNQYHGTFILHDFEDPFLRKKSVKDDSSKFFKFISPTISTWVQHVLQSMLNPISIRTLKDFHGSKTRNYGSMLYVYSWMIEEHQPIGINYQQIRDKNHIEDLMMQRYMEFDEDHRDKSRF